MKHIFATLFCVLLLAGVLRAQDDRPVADVFKEKLADMNSDDENKSRNARQDWQRLCFRLGAPGAEARKAEAVRLMNEALGSDENTQARFWMIRQLGFLGDASAADAVAPLVHDDDFLIRDESLRALANMPDKKAAEVLEKAMKQETEDTKKEALKQALQYWKSKPGTCMPCVPLSDVDSTVVALESNDKSAWDSTIPRMLYLPDKYLTLGPNFKDRFAKLSPDAKILFLDAMASVGNRSALSLAEEMVKSDDVDLKMAGLRALGPLGNAKSLLILLDNLKQPDDFGRTVRDSLRRLNFEGADEAIIAAFSASDDIGTKNDLLEILRLREGTIGIRTFETALSDADGGIRSRATGALEAIGEPSSVSPLVDRLFKENDRGLRDAAERAIVRINERYTDEDGKGVTLAAEYAERPEAEKIVILPILGKVGGLVARKIVEETLAGPGSAALKDAAYKALFNWPDASVAEKLYEIASAPGDPPGHPYAVAATRPYIRVVTLRTEGRAAKDSLELFEKAMKIAKTDDDRRFLLTRVETARSMEVFRFVAPYLDNAELDQAACRAVVDMANDHGFYMNNRKEIDPALDKVIEKSKDNNHVDRAKRYKERR